MSRFHDLEGPEEQEYIEALALFNELFDYLHTHDKLRRGIPRNEREKLRNMWTLSRHMGIALNKMINIIDHERMPRFAEINNEFGLNEQTLVDTVITQMVGHFIYNIDSSIA